MFEIPSDPCREFLTPASGCRSINLRIMGGKSNVPLLKTDTIFSKRYRLDRESTKRACVPLLGIGVAVLMIAFLCTGSLVRGIRRHAGYR